MSRPGRKARCAVLALFLLTAVWELWGCSVQQVTAAPPETEYGKMRHRVCLHRHGSDAHGGTWKHRTGKTFRLADGEI